MNHTIEREGNNFELVKHYLCVYKETVNDRHRVDVIENDMMAVDIREIVAETLVGKYLQRQSE